MESNKFKYCGWIGTDTNTHHDKNLAPDDIIKYGNIFPWMRVNIGHTGDGAIEFFKNIDTGEYLGFHCNLDTTQDFQKKDFKKISHEEIIMRLL